MAFLDRLAELRAMTPLSVSTRPMMHCSLYSSSSCRTISRHPAACAQSRRRSPPPRAASLPAQPEVCKAMDSLYSLTSWKNAEVRCGWYKLRCAAGDETVLPLVGQFLREQGRMKYLRPLYRALHRCKAGPGAARCRAFALETFEAARGAYHPIAAKMVAQDLGVGAPQPPQ